MGTPAFTACTHAATVLFREEWFLCKPWQIKRNQLNQPFLVLFLWSISKKPSLYTYSYYPFVSLTSVVHFSTRFATRQWFCLPRLHLTARLELSSSLVEADIHTLRILKYLPWCWLYLACVHAACSGHGEQVLIRVITQISCDTRRLSHRALSSGKSSFHFSDRPTPLKLPCLFPGLPFDLAF